jgi:hypothetical protein
VSQGVRYLLTGKPPDDWFGPSQPIQPMAQDKARGRQFDFPVGYNLRQTPRSEEAVSFAQLRGLADASDLVRLAVETRKDQLCRLNWVIRPRDKDLDPANDDRCKAITDFLQFPDREHDWEQWLRMVLEDLFVIDAPTVFPRLTRGGEIYSLDIIDGATIKRIINEDGRTPDAPDPAYQQILKGLPAVDYHRDELLYLPRNPRPNKIYGYGPVEQIVMTVNIAIRKQVSQLQYYTEGNIPDAIYSVPVEWNPDQVRQFQEYWDSVLEGNTAARRHAKFVPGGVKVDQTRDVNLKDEYDEWLARVICYAFSLPPTAFTKQQNRATAETAQQTAEEEGLAPLMQWVSRMMNQLIGRWWGFSDLCFEWEFEENPDQLQQAQISQIYVMAKVLTPDEVRDGLGLPPLTKAQQELLNPPAPEPVPTANEGQGGGKDAPNSETADEPSPTDKVAKKKASSRLTGIARPYLTRGPRFTRY